MEPPRLFEHALHSVPRPEHGYCVDDVARGLVVVCREPDPAPAVLRLGALYLDFTLAAGSSHIRATNSSMPPSNEFPGTNGYSTFLGDYTGIAVGSDGVAHPAWADNRNPLFTYNEAADARVLIFAGYDEDIYTKAVPLS